MVLSVPIYKMGMRGGLRFSLKRQFLFKKKTRNFLVGIVRPYNLAKITLGRNGGLLIKQEASHPVAQEASSSRAHAACEGGLTVRAGGRQRCRSTGWSAGELWALWKESETDLH